MPIIIESIGQMIMAKYQYFNFIKSYVFLNWM